MAQKQFIEIRNFLNRIVPRSRLEELGRETGAFKRNRKISASAFFWSLVMGYAVGNRRTIAGIRRSFEKSIGKSIVPSAFYDRFTPNLVNLLKEVLSELIQWLGSNLVPLKGQLCFFKDILITDSTLIRLHDLLEKTYPSVWTNYMREIGRAHV